MFAIALFLMTLLASLHSGLSPIGLGGEIILVEIADTTESRTRGLMDREYLAPNTGMLFVFEKSEALSFWMKDTLIPLSIAFFDEEKKLIETVNMPVLASRDALPPLFRSSRPALYALEVPEHWFQEKGIEKGMEFSFLDLSDALE